MIDVQTKPAPIERVTDIRPSEAIRLGCLVSGPVTGEWIDRDDQGKVLACALGAAMLGWGFGPGEAEQGEDPAEDLDDGIVKAALARFDKRRLACPDRPCTVWLESLGL